MGERKMVLCILGAMIGAGFASGREIMEFFSRFGQVSWVFVICAAAMMTACMVRLMKRGGCGIHGLFPAGRHGRWGSAFLGMLLISTGGGMIAAAGEVMALILPIHYARTIGFLSTMLLAIGAARYTMGALSALGKLLMPAIILGCILCLRIPAKKVPLPNLSGSEVIAGIIQVLGYAGMNVMLSAGVLCEAGGRCDERGLCRGAAWTGGAICGLLLLGNAVLLPHAAFLEDEALPMIVLLRAYGKVGYYLSAALLYLAIFTTLIAVLRGMGEMLRGKIHFPYGCAALGMGIVGLIGFERIVAVAYPALGMISLALIWFPQKKNAR